MQCILCGCNDTKAVTVKNKKGMKNFFRCAKCDFCFLDREQLLDSCAEKERYLHHQNSEDNLGYVEWLSGIVDEAAKVIDLKGKKILDYGCGHTPVLPKILQDKEHNISNVDYYDLYFYPDLNAGEKYSCIFSIEVFEHFRDVYKEIEYALSFLEKGGYFVLSTSFLLPEDKFASWWYIQDATHISFYSEQTLDWIAKTFSLRIVFLNGKNLVIFEKL